MKRLLVSVLVVFASSAAVAADFGLEVGFRQQSGSVDNMTGFSPKSQMGLSLGVSAFIPFQDAFGLRTGFHYVQRPLTIESDVSGLGDMKVNLSYVDVPLALAFKFEEYASVFAGTALALKLEDSVTSSGTLTGRKLTETKDMIFPIQFGASFKFASQLGATVFFETIPGETAKGLNGFRAVGANLVFTYE